jgi:hypothetical protein
VTGWTEGIFAISDTAGYAPRRFDHNADLSGAPVVPRDDIERALAADGDATIPADSAT